MKRRCDDARVMGALIWRVMLAPLRRSAWRRGQPWWVGKLDRGTEDVNESRTEDTNLDDQGHERARIGEKTCTLHQTGDAA